MIYSRLVFLLGAGASLEAHVPDFKAYWRSFASYFDIEGGGEKRSALSDAAWHTLRDAQLALPAQHSQNPERLCRMLRYRRKRLALAMAEQRAYDVSQDELACARSLAEAEYAVRSHFLSVLRKQHFTKRRLPAEYDLIPALARQLGIFDIFTMNNDLLVEWLCERSSVPCTDGVEADGFSDHRFEAAREGVRLYKLHGSINWHAPAFGPVRKTGTDMSIRGTLRPGHIAEQTAESPLIWPGVYEEFNEEKLRALERKHLPRAVHSANHVVIAGYRLGDSSVRLTLRASLARSHDVKVHIVCGAITDHVDHRYLRALAKDFPTQVKIPPEGAYFPQILPTLLPLMQYGTP